MPRQKRRRFRRGHAPYLTRIRLFWCEQCNVPRFDETPCSICGMLPSKVPISPPGDPFPAMDGHLNILIETVNNQFGVGTGDFLFPKNKLVVLNKVSSLDVMYEVVVDGSILGRLRFEIPDRTFRFLLTIEGGRRIAQIGKKKWVACANDVIPFLQKGANLLVPGIIDCDSEIKVGDEVWVVDSDKSVIAVGIARMSGKEILSNRKGYAIKIREFANPKPAKFNPTTATWSDAVAANKSDLKRIEKEATHFIQYISQKYQAPIVVGFSGGKDSLATYLLVERALGYSPPIFFMNTGLELPETVKFVHKFASERKTTIIGKDAGEQFWKSINIFGPPARDFRWCCKILKLGPAASLIAEKLEGKTLAFMGQRRLESFQRSIEPRVSSNPWVPGQISANPIQKWNALEVWLYIFQEATDFNPLYEKGYHRMGCYLCPASSLAEIERLKDTHPLLYTRWQKTLEKWASEHGYPQEWVTLGFWRWKHLPQGQLELAKKLGIVLERERKAQAQEMRLHVTKGISPCTNSGYTLEGQFASGLDIVRLSELLPIFGPIKMSEQIGAILIKLNDNTNISLFSSGSIVVRGPTEEKVERVAQQLERAIRRATFCQACGSCIPKCTHQALRIEEAGQISVIPEKCKHCLKCNEWPCPTYLS